MSAWASTTRKSAVVREIIHKSFEGPPNTAARSPELQAQDARVPRDSSGSEPGPVSKLDHLKRIVGTIAEFKMNQLNLYIEDAFPLQGHPLMGALNDVLSRDDFRNLVAYAAPYHVDIIPASEGCGHLHKILRFEQYSGMAERPYGDVLAADDQTATGFLGDMYTQINTVFSSRIYHIGCDEMRGAPVSRADPNISKRGATRLS